MAAFLIICRTAEVSPHHFEARVFVVPAGDGDSGIAVRSECRLFESADIAAAECIGMAEKMTNRLCRLGHQVVRVDKAAAMPPPAAPNVTAPRPL
jgi:hypothetical protein